jgi:hypothetical protein
MFTVSNANDFINELKELNKGDVLNIKGLGNLIVDNVFTETSDAKDEEYGTYIYNDVEVMCRFPRGHERLRV